MSTLDYITIKYDASGTEQWIARYDGKGNLGNYAKALTVGCDLPPGRPTV